jgi:hypothetical protein
MVDEGQVLCKNCQSSVEADYKGPLYRLHPQTKRLKKYFYLLLDKELYCKDPAKDFIGYRKQDEQQHKSLLNMAGVYLWNEEDYIQGNDTFYSFSLIFSNKVRLFYALT